MIHSIEIKDFRGLKNVNVKLGKYITAIAGKNGLGKSTVLALLGNSCELKIKDGKTLFGTQFRTQFGEIFKASREFDKSGSNKCSINFCDIESENTINDTKICRVTWQNDRFRIIPETIKENEKNSKKKEWPSIYLGLSRLYPIGEAKEDGLNITNIRLEQEEKSYFVKNYVKILNLQESEEISMDMISIDETKRKKGVGVSTSEYSSITNSSGQDNIGQIIMAILSFKRLSKQNKNYNGGFLLIDEIDATLHPIAQEKLISFLIDACKKLKLQVVFTTHSESLLRNICTKTLYNHPNIMNKCEINYFTKSNGPIDVLRNPEFTVIQNDLFINPAGINIKPVSIYTEDEEARWFFKNMTEKYSSFLKIVRVKLGCKELINLNNNDPIYFSNVLFCLDGDVTEQDLTKAHDTDNIIKLPGKCRPEQIVYEFLLKLDSNSQLWNDGRSIGFTKESLEENGPLSDKYKGKERERYKNWFKSIETILDDLNVFSYWIEENKSEYGHFIDEFKVKYNKIAIRILGNKI